MHLPVQVENQAKRENLKLTILYQKDLSNLQLLYLQLQLICKTRHNYFLEKASMSFEPVVADADVDF